jgi:hexosaminidase
MNIIPLPNKYSFADGQFRIDQDTTINYSGEFKISSNTFIKFIKDQTNLRLNKCSNSKINITLNTDLPQEGYIIEITKDSLLIEARSDQGAFYAIQSLKQISHSKDGFLTFDCLFIEDVPRFTHRSFMLDVARHFFDKNMIMKVIDYLAFHKFNTLHLHLSDDQGFRIQIDKYPLLTQIGSYRPKTKHRGSSYDNTPHSGFYTKEDIIEIVNYARENFIEVIPEIDLPGHTTAILASYPILSCSEEQVDITVNFGIKSNVLCASKPVVYQFIYDLIDELCEMFPSKYIHIGGDEVRYKNWKKCKSCNKLMKEKSLKSKGDLLRYFLNEVSSYIRNKGKTPIVWNDNINDSSNYNLIIQHWTPFKKKDTIAEINNGRKAIISNFFFLYLDYPYSMTPLEKTYNFNPVLKGVINDYNILGIEAPLWTEWINNKDALEKHLFPRLAAVSEVAWTNQINKDYSDFCNRLKHILNLYDETKISYCENVTIKKPRINRLINVVKWLRGSDKIL